MHFNEYIFENSINNETDFLHDDDVIMVQKAFSMITIIYIPCILVANSLVFWATILCSHFHTPINILLFSLSISDLLMAVFCIPMFSLSYMDSTKYIIYNNKYLCLGWFVSSWISSIGSVVHLMFIAIDRYISVQWPNNYKSIVTINRTIRLVIAIWVYILFAAFLPMMGWNNYDPTVTGAKRCNYYLVVPKYYAFFFCFLTIYTCTTIPCILYISICILTYRQVKVFQQTRQQMTKSQITAFNDRISSVKITIALMFMFIILWLPYLLIVPFKYAKVFSPKRTEIFKVISQLFYFANAMVNAPIYAIGRKDYQSTYMLMLRTKPWKWKMELHEFGTRKVTRTVTGITSGDTFTGYASYSYVTDIFTEPSPSSSHIKEGTIGSDID